MTTVRNRYCVPANPWRRWSARARHVFNEIYTAMMASPELYWHPKGQKIPRKHWKTTAWNAAWIAAGAADGEVWVVHVDRKHAA